MSLELKCAFCGGVGPFHLADCAYLKLGRLHGRCGDCGEEFPWHATDCLVWALLWSPLPSKAVVR